ncbi:MAG: flavodoxin family protein [Desulfovibrionaceae bacterium]|nr:flavodoxin family protein [Desulfovibrionaceae bacterium]MBF0514186.1 flavodoxin family protein [Desulfovibrionaceae bacterium]
MKVTAINGSARKDGNTAILLGLALGELEREGVQTELVQLAGLNLSGCIACYKCFENKDKHCAVKSDEMNAIIDKLAGADGILLGSPTYFGDLSANLKAVIERAGMVSRANGDMYARKPGAAVVAVRRAGAMHAFHSINAFFLIGQMVVVGSSYWNIGIGREIGQVEGDEEGKTTMKQLGANMAWLLKKLK